MKLIILLFLFVSPAAAFAKDPPRCTSYLLLIEQDNQTSSRRMTGPIQPQADWFKHHGNRGLFAGVCLFNPGDDANRKQLKSDTELLRYRADPTLGGHPLFVLTWEEHLVARRGLVEGHNVAACSGTVSTINPDGTLHPVGKVANDNKTAFQSPSVSMLKQALTLANVSH
jgi:hypothetical protein